MSEERIHRALSGDGTEIAGRVQGEGPPLVLVHGSLEDGEFLWEPMLPFLRERFTCYLMSTRGRGLSAANPDLSPGRLVEDVTAFAESIGEPVRLVGESAGGMLALGAAARSPAVSAVAAYEPVVFEMLGEEDAARIEQTAARVGEAAARGELAEGARTFAELLTEEDELAAVNASDYFERAAPYVPLLLQEIEQSGQSDQPGPTAPSVLERISAPVLLMHGERTALYTWMTNGVRHVAAHVTDARVREIAGAGHWAPVLHPKAIADELLRFFAN